MQAKSNQQPSRTPFHRAAKHITIVLTTLRFIYPMKQSPKGPVCLCRQKAINTASLPTLFLQVPNSLPLADKHKTSLLTRIKLPSLIKQSQRGHVGLCRQKAINTASLPTPFPSSTQFNSFCC